MSGPLFIALGVLVVAGAAKVARPSPTATALGAMGVPAPLVAARVMGVGEMVLGVAAAVFGAPALFALVAVAYGAFTLFIVWVLSGNQQVASCGCFGHEDTPPTPGHAAFNAAAAAVAWLAVADPVSIADFEGSAFEAVLAAGAVALGIWVVVAALTALPRTLSLARGTATPAAATFSLNRSTTSPRNP